MPPEKKFVLTHLVKDFRNLKNGDVVCSEEEVHFDVPWNMELSVQNGWVCLKLNCSKPSEAADEWAITADLEFKILSVKKPPVTQKFEYCTFKNTRFTYFDLHNFIRKWTVKQEHMANEEIAIEAHVKILKTTGIEKKKLINFDESTKDFWDVVLIVEDEKFFVSKLFLASRSSYFEGMFLRNFKETDESEITLTGIKSKDFQNFLELLYGESSIDEDTLEGILNLADMYDAKWAVRDCRLFYDKNRHFVISTTSAEILRRTEREILTISNFDESTKDFSDIVLIVEDEQFYVSKRFITSQSTRLIRNTEEFEMSEITLTDIKSMEFRKFLRFIYGECPVDEETVEGILNLADKYDAKLAIRKCEEFLVSESIASMRFKLRVATQYSLKKLKNDCLSKINTADEIRSVFSFDYSEMDPSVVGALLQKSLSLVP